MLQRCTLSVLRLATLTHNSGGPLCFGTINTHTHTASLCESQTHTHTNGHALNVHLCTPQHGQNALKIYDLNIPAGSSNLSNPAHSGFNYTADCGELVILAGSFGPVGEAESFLFLLNTPSPSNTSGHYFVDRRSPVSWCYRWRERNCQAARKWADEPRVSSHNCLSQFRSPSCLLTLSSFQTFLCVYHPCTRFFLQPPSSVSSFTMMKSFLSFFCLSLYPCVGFSFCSPLYPFLSHVTRLYLTFLISSSLSPPHTHSLHLSPLSLW